MIMTFITSLVFIHHTLVSYRIYHEFRCVEPSPSRQGASKTLVCLLNIQLQLSRLRLAQLLGGFHLIQRNQPLYNLASVFKVLVGYSVYRLDDIGEQGMQLVLGEETKLDRIQKCNEFLSRFENKNTACIGCGRRGWCCCWRC